MKYICDGCEKYPCDDTGIKLMKYCPAYSPKPKPKSNADRIRSMTDEEMAHNINDYFMGCPPVDCEDGGCEQCWLGWLKQEVDE